MDWKSRQKPLSNRWNHCFKYSSKCELFECWIDSCRIFDFNFKNTRNILLWFIGINHLSQDWNYWQIKVLTLEVQSLLQHQFKQMISYQNRLIWFSKGTNVDEIPFGRSSKGSWFAEEESGRFANEIPTNSGQNHWSEYPPNFHYTFRQIYWTINHLLNLTINFTDKNFDGRSDERGCIFVGWSKIRNWWLQSSCIAKCH